MFYYQLFNIQLFIQHVIYMTKVLITGGAGFIGSNFVKYMLEKYPDYEIVNLDALTYCGNLENLEDIEDNPNYAFVKGDIQDEELVDSIVKDTDYIVHFAAESHVDRSIGRSSNIHKNQYHWNSSVVGCRQEAQHQEVFAGLYR